MSMIKALKTFLCDDAGAVTVDWVVLSAVVLGLGMLVLNPIAFETTSSTQSIANDIRTSPVGYENH
jgi:uncharacterized membrane-anchored protein